MVNREDCGFSTISSIQNNKIIQKGKFFHLQENVLPRERQSQPIPTQLIPGRREQGQRQTSSVEKSKQNSQAGRVPPRDLVYPAPSTWEAFTKYLKRAMKAESESEKKNPI